MVHLATILLHVVDGPRVRCLHLGFTFGFNCKLLKRGKGLQIQESHSRCVRASGIARPRDLARHGSTELNSCQAHRLNEPNQQLVGAPTRIPAPKWQTSGGHLHFFARSPRSSPHSSGPLLGHPVKLGSRNFSSQAADTNSAQAGSEFPFPDKFEGSPSTGSQTSKFLA